MKRHRRRLSKKRRYRRGRGLFGMDDAMNSMQGSSLQMMMGNYGPGAGGMTRGYGRRRRRRCGRGLFSGPLF